MERLKKSLDRLKESLKEEKKDEKTSTLIQDFISRIELEIESICEDLAGKSEFEFTYFLEILNQTVKTEEFIENLEPKKIKTTLLSALPGCACPPQKRPCPAEQTTNEFVDSFVKLLESKT